MRVMVEVHADQFFVRNAQNALKRTAGSSFGHHVVQLSHCGGARGFKRQINAGYVWCGDADGHTVKLAVEFGHHQTHGLGGTCGGWDHAHRGGAGPVEILVHRIQRWLVACVAVDRRHEAFDDADRVVQHFGNRGQAVRRARGVRYNDVVGG